MSEDYLKHTSNTEDQINLYNIIFTLLEGWKYIIFFILVSLASLFLFNSVNNEEFISKLEFSKATKYESFNFDVVELNLLTESGFTSSSVYDKIVLNLNNFDNFGTIYLETLKINKFDSLAKSTQINDIYKNSFFVSHDNKMNNGYIRFSSNLSFELNNAIIENLLISSLKKTHYEVIDILEFELQKKEVEENQIRINHNYAIDIELAQLIYTSKLAREIFTNVNIINLQSLEKSYESNLRKLDKAYDIAEKLNITKPLVNSIQQSLIYNNTDKEKTSEISEQIDQKINGFIDEFFPLFFYGTLILDKEREFAYDSFEKNKYFINDSLKKELIEPNAEILAKIKLLEIKRSDNFIPELRSIKNKQANLKKLIQSLKDNEESFINENKYIQYNLNRIQTSSSKLSASYQFLITIFFGILIGSIFYTFLINYRIRNQH